MAIQSFEKSILFLSDKLKVVGAVALFGMAVLTCADVVGRVFKHPIFGSIELVSFMGVFAVAMALPVTQFSKGHIGVELFVDKLPRKGRLFFELCTEIVSLALFVIITWRMFFFSIKLRASGEVSMNLHLPEYAIVFVLACCCVVLCLVIVSSIIKILTKLINT
ncbi:MAG: TRAP transporter small permease [Proteobacteria bacterium]|nr:TRAP transporter small permease [Pseudomonadota bacterium]